MPLQAQCPACKRDYRLGDAMAGKTVQCKQCQAHFVVPAPGAAPMKPKVVPAPSQHVSAKPMKPVPVRAADDDVDDDRPRRKRRREREDESGSLLWVWILAGVGGVVVIGGLITAILLMSGGDSTPQPRPPIAQNPPNFHPNFPQQPPVIPPRPPVQQPPVQPIRPNPPPPKSKPVDPGEIPKIDNPPDFEGKNDLKPIGVWKVQPDPGPDFAQPPTSTKGAFPFVGNPTFVPPSTPSPFLAVRHGQFPNEGWQIFDLLKWKVHASFGKVELDHTSLSPDGKYLAGRTRKHGATESTIAIVDTAKGQFAQQFVIPVNSFLVRLVDFTGDQIAIIDGQGPAVRLHKLADGAEVKKYTVPSLAVDKDKFAWSPGRKQFAAIVNSDLKIFDVQSGDALGTLPFGLRSFNIRALSYSPDGKELAVWTNAHGEGDVIHIWNLAKGERTKVHTFAKPLEDLVKNRFSLRGRIFEWSPDKSGFLLYGQLLIDYASGALAFRIPEFGPGESLTRFVGPEHVVIASSQNGKHGMQISALPKSEIAANLKRTLEANTPTKLPEPMAASLAGIKELPLPASPSWRAVADPIESKSKLTHAVLKAEPADLLDVQFSNAATPLAVVLSQSTPDPLASLKQVRVDRYSLQTGQSLGGHNLLKIAFPKQPRQRSRNTNNPFDAHVSGDGARIALVRDNDDRVDVWNLTDGKHLCAWKPFGQDQIVQAFGFTDADHMLTIGAGKMVLWKLPECKAVYAVPGIDRGPLSFSPNRKFAAISAGAGAAIFETATGACHGLLPSDGLGQTLRNASFSPGGKHLVAAFETNGQTTGLASFDLTTGKMSESRKGFLGTGDVAWAGPDHVLLNWTLYAWKWQESAIYQYHPAHVSHQLNIAGAPDGRRWAVAQMFNGPPTLTAATIPDAAALQVTQLLAKAEPVFKPGAKFQINVNAPDDFRSKVLPRLESTVRSLQFEVAPGGFTVNVNAGEEALPQQFVYEIRESIGNFGPFGGKVKEKLTLNDRKVVVSYTIDDAQGQKVHEGKSETRLPQSMNFAPNSNDYEAQLVRRMWENATNFGIHIPRNKVQMDGKDFQLPKVGQVPWGA